MMEPMMRFKADKRYHLSAPQLESKSFSPEDLLDGGTWFVGQEFLEVTEHTLDLQPVQNLVDGIITSTAPLDSKEIDAKFVVAFHQSLQNLPADLCSDKFFWQYLSICKFPYFVIHRWWSEKDSYQVRFLGNNERNAFARSWWLAELTQSSGDYSKCDKCLSASGTSDIQQWIIDSRFGSHRPMARAFVDVCVDNKLTGKEVSKLAKALNFYLADTSLSHLTESDSSDLLAKIIS